MRLPLLVFLFITAETYAQNTFKALLKDEKTQHILPGAACYINKLKKGASADSNGLIIITAIPDGKFEIEFTFTGYEEMRKEFLFPAPDTIYQIDLKTEEKELGEVIVQTTRSSIGVRDLPSRIEFLPQEELDEKSTMKPGDIKMLLNETTGISTQQTSAVSGISNLRIQGLDGRYTQLLKDGTPLYNGFSGGLSIMQIPPLDLQQVEFMKGSSSTLYGGGAIAGLVNLISKTPGEKRECDLLLNGTSASGFDGSAFYSQKWNKIGTTVFSSYNFNAPYDPANIGLTAIPKTNRFTVNPKLFLYFNKKTFGWFSVNNTYEDRYGGDIEVIRGKTDNIHQYFERNKTFRLSTQLSFTHEINQESKIDFKNTVGFFDRKLTMPDHNFHGQEILSFSELNYVQTKHRTEWIVGLNEWTDDFTPLDTTSLQYHLMTFGAFAQNTFKASHWVSFETGLRIDHNSPGTKENVNGFFVLPRVNALLRINQHFTSRVGGGLGYKMPSPFTDEAEKQGYNDIQTIDFESVEAEKSYGINADVNFRANTDQFSININQLFFYTYIRNPIELEQNSFVNVNGHVDTKGAETNLKIEWHDFKFYLGYTLANVHEHFDWQNIRQPLSPKHRLNADITYEKADHFRIGLESYFTGKQSLSDGNTGKNYVVFGILIQKMWERYSVYLNCENVTDQRQTRWETIYTGSITNPTFKDIYAPLDGIVVNAGMKIKL